MGPKNTKPEKKKDSHRGKRAKRAKRDQSTLRVLLYVFIYVTYVLCGSNVEPPTTTSPIVSKDLQLLFYGLQQSDESHLPGSGWVHHPLLLKEKERASLHF